MRAAARTRYAAEMPAPKSGSSAVDDYMAAQDEKAREALQKARDAVRKAVPGAEEVISYKMPAYRLHGRIVLYMAAWKEHYSIYPATAGMVAAFGDRLTGLHTNKSTLRFPYAERVPTKLIGDIARFRAQEVAERVAAKKKTRAAAASR
jgi:uncharacterized protein YdhG (YjbR/CyaY superfamily)